MNWNLRGWAIGLLLVTLAIGGCAEGEQGDEGRVAMRVRTSGGVTGVTLTGIGINITNAIPDPDKAYKRDDFKGSVQWYIGATPYHAQVDIQPNEGEEGEKGLLPGGGSNCCAPILAAKGETAGNREVVMMLVGDDLLIFEVDETISGT